jgi:RHS repeat-associated protein
MQKLDDTGASVMSVTYDPFGNIISGTLEGEYGFSTKPLINDLNWYYYGFRYYDPVTGRWPSRDPIEEEGGLNLYAMVFNNPVNFVDVLGLSANCCGGKELKSGQECCGGVPFSGASECCENNTVVQKVTIYVFQGKLGGDGDGFCEGGTFSHSYVSGSPVGVPSYGKHPRPFGESGSSISGPGYINREDQRSDGLPGRDPFRANRTERKVCPAEKDRMLKEGPTEDPYFVIGKRNCHGWAQGKSR